MRSLYTAELNVSYAIILPREVYMYTLRCHDTQLTSLCGLKGLGLCMYIVYM